VRFIDWGEDEFMVGVDAQQQPITIAKTIGIKNIGFIKTLLHITYTRYMSLARDVNVLCIHYLVLL
jgi:hypothetical protein